MHWIQDQRLPFLTPVTFVFLTALEKSPSLCRKIVCIVVSVIIIPSNEWKSLLFGRVFDNTAIFFLKPLLFVENHSCLIWLQNSFYMVFVVCDQLVAFVFFEQFAWDFLICKVACYHQFFVSKRSLICIEMSMLRWDHDFSWPLL